MRPIFGKKMGFVIFPELIVSFTNKTDRETVMKRILNLCVFFLFFGPLLLDSLAAQVPVLDSKQYLRTTGKANVYSDTFRAIQGAGLLLVENGIEEDPDTMLSSAEVWVNGVQVFGPSDFNKTVHHLEASVNLGEANTIQVILNSKPGSYLTAKITEDIPRPTISLSANPSEILLGDSTTLTWNTTLADSVTIDNGIDDVAINGFVDVKPSETTTYNVTATGLGGTISQSTTVTVYQPPTVTISADPDSISSGENLQLTWSSTNADTVTITPDIGAVSPSGSKTVSPSETTTYHIKSDGRGGSASANVTVVVTSPDPMITIIADPDTITKGLSTLLTWESANVDSVYIDNGIGNVDSSGSLTISPTHTTTYTISGTNSTGIISSKVTVIVEGSPEWQSEGTFGELYNHLIPQDATITSYDEKRFSVLTGLVHDESGLPLEEVIITIHKHPEFGSAATDSEGRFSLPVEGGGVLTIIYTKDGRITSHRQVQTTWNDISIADTIQMLPEDDKYTSITFDGNTSSITTHTSSEIIDDFGTRSTTLVFSGDNRVFIVDEKGNDVSELDTINVRATEFVTPESMPAILPPNSGYTYCIELKADGVDRLRFENPIQIWVDNFLGFNVGAVVPVGYYDRDRAVWVPSNNGVVVRLLDTDSDGTIDALDSTGDGQPDDLNHNGVYSDDVAGLTSPDRYHPGDTFWRAEVKHFTPWDCNWPYGPPAGAKPPDVPNPDAQPEKPPCDGSSNTNSYVKHKTRVFHEDIPIPGTDLTLHYASNRVKGYKHVVTVPVSGNTVPAPLKSIIAKLEIAGKIYIESLPPNPNQNFEFIWDGTDYLGNPVEGEITGHVSIGYIYDAVYLQGSSFGTAFAEAGTAITGIRARNEIISWKHSEVYISGSQEWKQFGNGWSLSNHNRLIQSEVLERGNGTSLSINSNNVSIINTVAGIGTQGYTSDNVPATSSGLSFPHGVAVDDIGNIFIADGYNRRIRKVDENGIITTVTGDGTAGDSGDGGLAINAKISYGNDVDIDASGNIFIADGISKRIRKVDVNGIINTVAGTGSAVYSGDNGPAIYAGIDISSFAIDNIGNIFIAEYNNNRVRKVDTNGIITTVAGTGVAGFSGDNGIATNAKLYRPWGVATDNRGNLFIADTWNHRIRKVDTNGIITTVAGIGSAGYSGDNSQAKLAKLNYPYSVTIDVNGNLLVADTYNNRIRKVDTNGIITSIAGNGVSGYSGDYGPALKGGLYRPIEVVADPIGNLYISDEFNHRIRKIQPSPLAQQKRSSLTDRYVFDDDEKTHIFSASGRNLYTVNSHTGKLLTTFNYDYDGHLVSIEDRFGNAITIEIDSTGRTNAIISPFGHRTELITDSNGNLTNVKFEDMTGYSFAYTDDGLMTSMTDPNNFTSTHDFDVNGRVLSTTDPENAIWTLRRITTADGKVTSSITSGEGNTTSHLDIRELGGAYRTTTTFPDGTTNAYLQTNQGMNDRVEECRMPTETEYTLDNKFKTKIPRKITTTSPSGLISQLIFEKSYTVDNAGMTLVSTTTLNKNGKIFTKNTDYQTGEITLTSAEGRISSQAFNLDNLLVNATEISGLFPINYDYDPRGQLASIITGERISTYEYDARGNVATVTDSLNHVTSYLYDLRNRVTQISKPDLGSIGFEYDANGNMTMLTTPVPANNLFEYNGVNKLVRYKTSLNSTTEYTFDKERKLTSVTLPSGRTIANNYSKGLLSQTVTPEWTTSYQYACAGLPSLITQAGEQLSYGYDGTLLTSINQTGAVNANLTFTYNSDFNINSFTYSGKTESFTYDNDQLPISIGRFTITRNAGNGLPESVHDTAFTLNRSFNGYGEISATEYAVNGANAFSQVLTRDSNSRITARSETVGGVTTEYGYAYDPVGRLLTVSRDNALVEEYRYDTNGNRTYEMNTLRGINNRAYTHSIEDHIVTAGAMTFEFDLDDNLSRKVNGPEITDFQYSSTGELMHVLLPDGTSVDYLHDPLGRRVAKLLNDSIVEKYLWQDLTTLLAVYDGNNNLIQRFEYADDRVPYAMTSGGATYYLAYDQVGSLRTVANTAGTIIKRVDYDAFGNILNDTNPGLSIPFGFAGGLHDRSTGLVRFGFRDYSPEIGRWTAKDPILFAGGDTNLYGYVSNDPVNWVDPLGLLSQGANFAIGAVGTTVTIGLSFTPLSPAGGAVAGGAIAGVLTAIAGGDAKEIAYNAATAAVGGPFAALGKAAQGVRAGAYAMGVVGDYLMDALYAYTDPPWDTGDKPCH